MTAMPATSANRHHAQDALCLPGIEAEPHQTAQLLNVPAHVVHHTSQPSFDGPTRQLFLDLQVIPSDRHSSIRRTSDGTPWEVALTLGVKHPNIIACLAAGTFQSEVGGMLLADAWMSGIMHLFPNEVSCCDPVAAGMLPGCQVSCISLQGEPRRSGVCTVLGGCLAARTFLDEVIHTVLVLCTACTVTLQARCHDSWQGHPLLPGQVQMRSGSRA